MSAPTRPRAPRYAAATRRLALLRIGLPTLLACVIAAGPSAASVSARAAENVAAQVAHATAGGRSAQYGHSDTHRGGDGGGARTDAG